MDLQAGRTVAGCLLVERLGQGLYGQVWKASLEDRTVVLKLFGDRRPVAQFRREALAQYALGRLSGEEGRHFPRVEALDLEHDPPFLRMEFLEGRTLDAHLGEADAPLDHRLVLARRILEALEVVHRHGYVHGDLAPGNVIVDPRGAVKLIDVGYGALFERDPADVQKSGTKEDQSMGVAAPLYAAPERFAGDFSSCGKAADVFSFGKVLYAAATGEAPYVVKPLSKRFPSLGPAADEFLFRCVEEKAAARFADAAAARAAFEKAFRPEPASGEFRAECPECSARLSIPGGWAGERFACRHCGKSLEVLFYDEESRHASTSVVGAPVERETGIHWIEDDVVTIEDDGRARKFCPNCGRSILVEAKKCRYCAAWVDETARRAAQGRPPRRPPGR